MKIILLLPDYEAINKQLETLRKTYAKLHWCEAADSIEAVAKQLTSDEAKNGCVMSGFSKDPDAPKQLHALLKEQQGKKVQLPLYLYWNGKAPKDQREAIKTFRQEIKSQAEYVHAHRRLVNFGKIKKMGKAFKEAKKRSKPGRMIRMGVSVAAAIFFAAILVTLLFFRDPIMRSVLVSTIQGQTGAKVDVDTFQTGLSDVSLQIEGFAAANAAEPMQNSVSFEQLQTSWDVGPLFSGKLHAQQLTLSGVGFHTPRSESGALPIASAPEAAETEAAAMVEELGKPDSAAESDFVTTLNNTMGDFEPPKKEDLESTKVLTAYQTQAEQHKKELAEKVQAIDVQRALAESKAAAQNLKAVTLTPGDQAATQKKLDDNKKALEALQLEIAADAAQIQKDTDALKDFKVDLKDLKKAKEQVEAARKLKDRIDALKQKIAKGKALADDSRAQVQAQSQAVQEQAAAAKKQFQEQMDAVRAPLVKTQEQIKSVQTEAAAAQASIAEAKPAFNQAVERDKQKVKEQYSVDGIRSASKMLMEELVGFEFFDKLEGALVWYRRIKPWLPVSEKSSKPKPAPAGKGKNYDFPATAEEGGLASLYIAKMSLDGVFPLNGKDMAFTGTVSDLSSNLAYTQKPVRVEAQGKDTASAQSMQLDVHMATDSLIRGEVHMAGLQWSGEAKQSGKAAGIMPGPMHSDNVSIGITEMVLGDQSLDAKVRIHLQALHIEAPSGKDVHPEILAAFTSVYAQVSDLTVDIGLGEHRSLTTTPDLGDMLGKALEQRIAKKLEAAQAQAEQEIRDQGAAQLKELEALGGDLANPEALQAKQAELEKAFADINKIGSDGEAGLDTQAKEQLQGLEQFNAAIKQQDDLVAKQTAELDALKQRINKERKRIEKDMLGGGLKKLIPKF